MTRDQSKLGKTDIRREMDRLLGSPLTDLEWGYLEKDHYIDDIVRSNPSTRSDSMVEVVDKVRLLRNTFGTPRPPNEQKNQDTDRLSEPGTKQPTQHAATLSHLVAQEAVEDAAIHVFRTEVLDGKYLTLEEIEEWIQQHALKDGPPTSWLNNIPVSRVVLEELMKQVLGITPDTETFSLKIPMKQAIEYGRQETHLLQYPGLDRWERCIPTAIGGVLERLRQLSNGLAKQYKWSNQQATAFILTGRTPLVSPINITLQISSRTLSSRIVLDIDPTVSPAEVAQCYRRNRKKMMAAQHRNLSEKHIQLAHFNSTRPDTETWAIKMREWNKTQRAEWRYKTVRNFASDCTQARDRLLRARANDLAVFGQQGLPH